MKKRIDIIINETSVEVEVEYEKVAEEMDYFDGTGEIGGIAIYKVLYKNTDITSLLQFTGIIEQIEEIINL